jgi:hypothetical protein
MKRQNWINRYKNRGAQWLFSILLIGSLFWLGMGIQNTGPAYAEGSAGRIHLQEATITPTPDSLVDDLSPEVIREGRPVGILVGASIIFVIILASTAASLFKRDQPSDDLK